MGSYKTLWEYVQYTVPDRCHSMQMPLEEAVGRAVDESIKEWIAPKIHILGIRPSGLR